MQYLTGQENVKMMASALTDANAGMPGFRNIGANIYAGAINIWTGISTSMWFNGFMSSQAGVPTSQYPWGQVADGVTEDGSCYVVGTPLIHTPIAVGNGLVFFKISDYTASDEDVIAELALLPWFSEMGNTLASTTDKLKVIIQIYEAGMWFFCENNLPPLDKTCLVNIQFGYDDSWQGHATNDLVSVGSGGSPTFVVSGGSARSSSYHDSFGAGATWNEEFIFDGTFASSSDDISSTNGEITYEYVGRRDDSTSTTKYLWDGRNGDGTWMLTRYPTTGTTYDFNWANNCKGDTPQSQGRMTYPHHFIATAKSSTNTSRMFYGDSLTVTGNASYDWGVLASGTATTAMTEVGVDCFLGARYNATAAAPNGNYQGTWTMFRIWDEVMTDDECEILWLHQKRRITNL